MKTINKKPKVCGGAVGKTGDSHRIPKLWTNRFKPHKPFLEALDEKRVGG